ncbi:MAG: transcription termination/antitermination protein NusA [Clostridia bacterium]|nr:transcription termination/antitermination protein NusA [Clostridia bacterium]
MIVNDEFFLAVKQLEKEKNIPAEKLYETIANALATAKKHDFGGRDDVVFCDIDPEKREINVYAVKTVVSEIEDAITDILPEDAQKYMPGAEPGDLVRIPLEIADFGRIVAQKVKHVIRQGIREVEQTRQSAEFQGKNQEIVTAVVQSIDAKTGNVSLEINGTESVLPKAEQIPGETFRVGDKIKVFIFDVRSLDKGLRIRISRTHSGFVKRLLENEVPEIADGVVEIKAIAREAGSRTKVAVVSHDENVDPVGACIGQRGARIDNIRFILGGDEKIDVIPYSEDIDAFIASALAPAEILKVEQDPNEEIVYHVTVPDNQLSLAIGNKGQNARLAVKLTGKKIDINPESGFYDPDKAAEALS